VSLAACLAACEGERTVWTLAGGIEPGEQDGIGEQARFRDPRCLALAEDGVRQESLEEEDAMG